jgi:hypothetical protein
VVVGYDTCSGGGVDKYSKKMSLDCATGAGQIRR